MIVRPPLLRPAADRHRFRDPDRWTAGTVSRDRCPRQKGCGAARRRPGNGRVQRDGDQAAVDLWWSGERVFDLHDPPIGGRLSPFQHRVPAPVLDALSTTMAPEGCALPRARIPASTPSVSRTAASCVSPLPGHGSRNPRRRSLALPARSQAGLRGTDGAALGSALQARCACVRCARHEVCEGCGTAAPRRPGAAYCLTCEADGLG